MEITFKAFEYNADDTFSKVEYRIKGDTSTGWDICRNNKDHLELGSGYELLKTIACGICSTDIDRRFLPFDLPQVIGHEVIAQRMSSMERVAVEINDSPLARGEKDQDPFCRAGLHTHSPGRMALGIDRLPGGFGPYLLAPVKAVVPLEGLDENTAVLIEPFAAALQAVTASPPQGGDEVAVLGPGRLGALLIAALAAYRASSGFAFQIGAVAKYDRMLGLYRALGADFGVNITKTDQSALESRFDLVFDTTGTVSGFETALHLSTQQIHLKSTNGQPMCGLDNLTAFVVDELSLLSFSKIGYKTLLSSKASVHASLQPIPRDDCIQAQCMIRSLYV
ncbi:MAG: alcohol dehydrogenase catalytic domain-containing protein [Desulfobacteraceae bacterium]|jgi:threonine dehydrogenase-like Zn-dependent dehydrogenase